jgi:hypothetical protein
MLPPPPPPEILSTDKPEPEKPEEPEELRPELRPEPEELWEAYTFPEDHVGPPGKAGDTWWWNPRTEECSFTSPPGWYWCATTRSARFSRAACLLSARLEA